MNLANFVFCVSDENIGQHFPEFCYDQLSILHSSQKHELLKGKMAIMGELTEGNFGDEDIKKALEKAEERIKVQKDKLRQSAENKKQSGIENYNKDISDKDEYKKLYKQRSYLISRYKELTRQLNALNDPNVDKQIKLYIAYYYMVVGRVRDWSIEADDKKRNQLNARKFPFDEMKMRAFEFMFSRGFPSYRASKESITGVNATGVRQFKKHLDIYEKSWLVEYHQKMDHVEVWCKDFVEILEQYGSNSKAVFCLDPPYFLTCQYDMGFPDEYHLKMLDWLRTTPCKWVFCCKDKGTNMIEARNWKSRLNDSRKLIYVDNMDSKDEMPSLSEYFKGFLYPMKGDTEQTHSFEKIKDVKIYCADIREEVKRVDRLYVYYLPPEKSYGEIMVSNIEVPNAEVKVLRDYGIRVKDFEDYFHFG